MDNGDELRSGGCSPAFEWGMDGNGRDTTFEPVPLFDANSTECLEPAPAERSQKGETEFDTSSGQVGEKRSADVMADIMDYLPAITRRKKKAKGIPKRPLSAYALFFAQERDKLIEPDGRPNRSLSYEELENVVGMRWKGLSEAERKEYEVLSLKDCERYRDEMQTFNDDKKKAKAKTPQLRPQETRKEQPPILPLPPHPVSHATEMGSFMPPPSPSTSRNAPPVYGSMPLHGHPSDPYPPSPHPSMARRYPNETPSHYYPPPPTSSSSHGRHGPHVPFPAIDRDLFPIPPGMELMLPDRDGRERKYRVQYACYTMTRHAAQEYIDRLTSVIARGRPVPAGMQSASPETDSSSQGGARPPGWAGGY